jgi:amino acid transporter
VLSLVISTTLISYLGIVPALARLRRKLPDVPRPYRAPFATTLSTLLTLLFLFAAVQLMAPGLGKDWFGEGFRPSGWAANEKWTYLIVELVPLVVFIGVGVLFWALGKPTRQQIVHLEQEVEDALAPVLDEARPAAGPGTGTAEGGGPDVGDGPGRTAGGLPPDVAGR